MSGWRGWVVRVAAVGLVGCSGGEVDQTTRAESALCGEEDRARCGVNQQACSLEGGQPVCRPCEGGQYADDSGRCVALVGTRWAHDFPEQTSQPGEEILRLCRSWTIGNDTELWVNAVEMQQDEGSHHSNWTFVPEDSFNGPDGIWACKDRKYDQLSAALAGGVIYAQSTQAKREVQKFPEGAAIRIPPRSRIISDIHILNTTDAPVRGHVNFSLYAVPPEQVTVKLAPFHVTYGKLAIPPRSRSRFSGQCELGSQYQSQTGAPTAMKVYFVLPHTHAQGRRFFLQAVGGAADGTTVIDVEGYNGEARGRRFTPPLDLAGVSALRFGCEFDNPRDSVIEWGFGDKEMCEALGFIESPLAFESSIDEVKADGMDGEIQQFTGKCSTVAFPWGR